MCTDASWNWRDPKERDRDGDKDRDPNNSTRNRPWDRTNNDREDNTWKTGSHSNLPEWCEEDSEENITYGTFDSSGAFKTLKVFIFISLCNVTCTDDTLARSK